MKKKTDDLTEKKIKVDQESQKKALLADDADRNFYKNTSNQRPKTFHVMDIFPGKDEQQVAELLAEHFNSVSNEFSPLSKEDIPDTFLSKLPKFLPYQVAGRLRSFKKPKSMVPGDILPDLVTRHADLLAIPLTSIDNEFTRTVIWLSCWKEEFITIIPKNKSPTEIGHLRNISCTMLASKVYESYVLE